MLKNSKKISPLLVFFPKAVGGPPKKRFLWGENGCQILGNLGQSQNKEKCKGGIQTCGLLGTNNKIHFNFPVVWKKKCANFGINFFSGQQKFLFFFFQKERPEKIIYFFDSKWGLAKVFFVFFQKRFFFKCNFLIFTVKNCWKSFFFWQKMIRVFL